MQIYTLFSFKCVKTTWPTVCYRNIIGKGGEDNNSHDPTLLHDILKLGLWLVLNERPLVAEVLFCMFNKPSKKELAFLTVAACTCLTYDVFLIAI